MSGAMSTATDDAKQKPVGTQRTSAHALVDRGSRHRAPTASNARTRHAALLGRGRKTRRDSSFGLVPCGAGGPRAHAAKGAQRSCLPALSCSERPRPTQRIHPPPAHSAPTEETPPPSLFGCSLPAVRARPFARYTHREETPPSFLPLPPPPSCCFRSKLPPWARERTRPRARARRRAPLRSRAPPRTRERSRASKCPLPLVFPSRFAVRFSLRGF